MGKLTMEDRLVYISTWQKQKEEARKKIREEAELRLQQLREFNKQVLKMIELVNK